MISMSINKNNAKESKADAKSESLNTTAYETIEDFISQVNYILNIFLNSTILIKKRNSISLEESLIKKNMNFLVMH